MTVLTAETRAPFDLAPIASPWRRPLPAQERASTRFFCRALVALARRSVVAIEGAETLRALPDPFVVAANHNQRLEAVLLPALLAFLRGGRLVHFLADWPMALVPGIGLLYRCGGVILVGGKSARWPWLDLLRPLLVDARPAHERALEALRAGRSVGLFPEGTMNRRPDLLLRGRAGAARLAVEAGVPLLPIGLSFPGQAPGRPIPDGAPMAVSIGAPLAPPPPGSTAAADFHVCLMSTLAGLSGKTWRADAPRRKMPCASN